MVQEGGQEGLELPFVDDDGAFHLHPEQLVWVNPVRDQVTLFRPFAEPVCQVDHPGLPLQIIIDDEFFYPDLGLLAVLPQLLALLRDPPEALVLFLHHLAHLLMLSRLLKVDAMELTQPHQLLLRVCDANTPNVFGAGVVENAQFRGEDAQVLQQLLHTPHFLKGEPDCCSLEIQH